jgi:hypothetical protein
LSLPLQSSNDEFQAGFFDRPGRRESAIAQLCARHARLLREAAKVEATIAMLLRGTN